ncbi:flagellar protein FlaG [Virgibacillus necropolis]|uniref:flagellar protein FlaG n=1 Tax=Virgibacillus necropolis TaxID=163877 RepID=UPI00384ABF62
MRLEKSSVTGSQPLQSETYNRQTTSANDGTIEKTSVHQKIELHDQGIINKENIETIVSKLNGLIEPLRTNLKFEYHEKLDEYYVTVINPKTDEVIKEIPSKKMLDMYAAMAEFMGLLVDEKV